MKTPKSLLAIDQILKETPLNDIRDDEFTVQMFVDRANATGAKMNTNQARCRLERMKERGLVKTRIVCVNGRNINAYSIVSQDA